jgi:large subunit ribosomal protein L31
MKKDIHPKYNSNSVVNCACGANFKVGSIMDKIDIEICSQCHPFYTGNEKVLDTAGRVDRFKKRVALAKAPKSKK